MTERDLGRPPLMPDLPRPTENIDLAKVSGVTDVDWEGQRLNYLEVDGDAYKPDFFHEFSLRWTTKGEPTLYYKGKRVTKPWKFRCDLDMPADPHGGNANTAE